MDKPSQPSAESEADFESIRRANNLRSATVPDTTVAEANLRRRVLDERGEQDTGDERNEDKLIERIAVMGLMPAAEATGISQRTARK